MPRYAGIDLGATHLRAAVADDDGTRIATERRRTPRGPAGRDVTEAVLGTLAAACEAAGIDPTELRAVGIASFGPLDLARGAIVDPANLPDSVDAVALRDPVANLAGTERVYLHNDAIAGVIGERFYADAPGDAVYLTISSGIGAGVAVDGNVLSGRGGNAGEVGHTIVDPDGRMTCGCGGEGHWEAYCGGESIPEYARAFHANGAVETTLSLSDVEAPDVFAAAARGDPLAERVISRLARWNAIGAANLVHAFAPSLIAVGGAVALENEEAVIDPIRERVPDLTVIDAPEIRPTELGEDVVLSGAIASALTGGT